MNHPEMNIDNAGMDKIRKAIRAIEDGPRVLQLYMNICSKCGTCAMQCHVSQSDPDRRTNPACRSDRIRGLYQRCSSPISRVASFLTGKGDDLTQEKLEEWVRDFYECSGCRRCAKFCPFGIDNSVITRKGRAILHAVGLTPSKLTATQELSYKFGNEHGLDYAGIVDAIRLLEIKLEERHGVPIRIPIDQEADVLFIAAPTDIPAPNPSPREASFPETLMGCAAFFHASGIKWTMSSETLDGVNFGLFTGDDAYMKQKNKLLHDAAMKFKVKQLVIGECGHAYRVAKHIGGPNYWGPDLPYEITNIFNIAAEQLRKGSLKLDPSSNPFSVTYHDPCNFARSAGIIDSPRELLRACVSDLREMTPNRDVNWCCGAGGGLGVLETREGVKKRETSFHEYRMRIAGAKKVKQIEATAAQYVASPCANCKRQISQLMEYHNMDVRVGGVFDLFNRALIIPK